MGTCRSGFVTSSSASGVKSDISVASMSGETAP